MSMQGVRAVASGLALRLALGLALFCDLASAATECGRLSPSACREREARTLMAGYLAGRTFVDTLPRGSGSAEGVSGSRRITRTLSGPLQVSGTLRIQQLRGLLQLKLASTRDPLQYGRPARVAGTIAVAQGRLRLYSPVDMDFWQMAALFMDRVERGAPTPAGLRLQGWLVTDIEAGAPRRFNATLLAVGGDHFLLLRADPDEARGIAIDLDEGDQARRNPPNPETEPASSPHSDLKPRASWLPPVRLAWPPPARSCGSSQATMLAQRPACVRRWRGRGGIAQAALR